MIKKFLKKLNNKTEKEEEKQEDTMISLQEISNYLANVLPYKINQNILVEIDKTNNMVLGFTGDDLVFTIKLKKNEILGSMFILSFYIFTPSDLTARITKVVTELTPIEIGYSYYFQKKTSGNIHLDYVDFNKDVTTFSKFVAGELSEKLKENENIVN